jgi:hypothetical protein
MAAESRRPGTGKVVSTLQHPDGVLGSPKAQASMTDGDSL